MESLEHRYLCKQHNCEIIYVCLQNEWHCEELCAECIPIHTECHTKNKTVSTIQNISKVID